MSDNVIQIDNNDLGKCVFITAADIDCINNKFKNNDKEKDYGVIVDDSDNDDNDTDSES